MVSSLGEKLDRCLLLLSPPPPRVEKKICPPSYRQGRPCFLQLCIWSTWSLMPWRLGDTHPTGWVPASPPPYSLEQMWTKKSQHAWKWCMPANLQCLLLPKKDSFRSQTFPAEVRGSSNTLLFSFSLTLSLTKQTILLCYKVPTPRPTVSQDSEKNRSMLRPALKGAVPVDILFGWGQTQILSLQQWANGTVLGLNCSPRAQQQHPRLARTSAGVAWLFRAEGVLVESWSCWVHWCLEPPHLALQIARVFLQRYQITRGLWQVDGPLEGIPS